MRVDWLSLTQFRSYVSLEWRPDAGLNLLIGRNAAGKTNLLEAVGYLSRLKSFRGAADPALVGEEADSAVIRAGVASAERERLVEIELRREGRRRAQVDKTPLRRTADLLGVLRVIAFLPEDLDLIKRGPGLRRELLDDAAVQLWPAAHLDQLEFDRALRQRNAFLKTGDRDETTLGVWDARMAQSGGRVMARRARALDALSPHLMKAYSEVAADGAKVSLDYIPDWWQGPLGTDSAASYADALARALEASRKIDYERRMTTVGPHRDDPAFTIDDHPARTHGSQGEQRTLALAVRLAAHRAVFEEVGDNPVLLLDDVFSELDSERAAALAGALPSEAQTLITSARPEDVPIQGTAWTVAGGEIQ
ncbi:MAG: DNA replication/repair protein RecF [Acidimicrobiia bacterium]|nr:DNA replication/repair protein RecF [Acidimicrobiia bacterium]